jgi:Trp operon repressor
MSAMGSMDWLSSLSHPESIKCIKVTFANRIMHNLNQALHNFKIEDRRRKVSSLLAQSMTESEIAQMLEVDQSTISRDVKVLKELSKQFVYDLAKSDLAYGYKQCIDGVEEVKRYAWSMFKNEQLGPKDKLSVLKLIKECDEAKFALFKDGPTIMNLKSLEERLNKIESGQINR